MGGRKGSHPCLEVELSPSAAAAEELFDGGFPFLVETGGGVDGVEDVLGLALGVDEVQSNLSDPVFRKGFNEGEAFGVDELGRDEGRDGGLDVAGWETIGAFDGVLGEGRGEVVRSEVAEEVERRRRAFGFVIQGVDPGRREVIQFQNDGVFDVVDGF